MHVKIVSPTGIDASHISRCYGKCFVQPVLPLANQAITGVLRADLHLHIRDKSHVSAADFVWQLVYWLIVCGPIQKLGPFISFRGEEGLIS